MLSTDLLGPALGIAASPFGIVPAILVLFSARPRLGALGFLAGWSAGVLAGLLIGAVASEALSARGPGPLFGPVRVAAGLALLWLAARQWRGRHAGETPAWMAGIASAGPLQALKLGLLLSVANPKVLLLAVAGGLAMAGPGLVAPALGFVLVASATVAAPPLLHLLAADRVMAPLGRARDWLLRHNGAVVALVLAVIGAKLLTVGLNALAG